MQHPVPHARVESEAAVEQAIGIWVVRDRGPEFV